MNKIVIDYINRTKEEEKEKIAQVLMSKGIYEKKFVDSFHSNAKWDSNAQQYFITKPIKITNEEYEQLKDIVKPKTQTAISICLQVIAWIIFIVGFIMGIILGQDHYWNDVVTPIICWATSLISGVLFLAIAKTINLLNDIKNK